MEGVVRCLPPRQNSKKKCNDRNNADVVIGMLTGIYSKIFMPTLQVISPSFMFVLSWSIRYIILLSLT